MKEEREINVIASKGSLEMFHDALAAEADSFKGHWQSLQETIESKDPEYAAFQQAKRDMQAEERIEREVKKTELKEQASLYWQQQAQKRYQKEIRKYYKEMKRRIRLHNPKATSQEIDAYFLQKEEQAKKADKMASFNAPVTMQEK